MNRKHVRRKKRPPVATPLYTWRKRAGLSQTEAADLLHTTQTAYSRIERGERRPKRELAKRLLKITKVPPTWLLGVA